MDMEWIEDDVRQDRGGCDGYGGYGGGDGSGGTGNGGGSHPIQQIPDPTSRTLPLAGHRHREIKTMCIMRSMNNKTENEKI